jgi:hypothetical protein
MNTLNSRSSLQVKHFKIKYHIKQQAKLKIQVFWDLTPCKLVVKLGSFETVATIYQLVWHIPEHLNL